MYHFSIGVLLDSFRTDVPAAMRQAASLGLDGMPAPADRIERDYQAALRALWDDRAHVVSRSDAAMSDMRDYYTLWAHQIKTPIAAMDLLLQAKEEDTSALEVELQRISQYVDMVLQYLRLDSETRDLDLQRCQLDAVIRQTVRKYAKLFILKKIRLTFQETHLEVLSDEKWLAFLLEQVLSNALKYTPAGGEIRIFQDPAETLVIADTGIGIAPEDLPRIFDKGYTGHNGRMDKKATGIGLYLCRRVTNLLGHTITVTSQLGQGTQVHLGLGRPKFDIE